jgi:hypothetical protein
LTILTLKIFENLLGFGIAILGEDEQKKMMEKCQVFAELVD